MEKRFFTLVVLLLGVMVASSSPSSDPPETIALKQLKAIEQQLDSIPDLSILELNKITQQCIKNDWNNALQQSYLLTGRAYKELKQPQLALYYLREAEKLNNEQVVTTRKNEEVVNSKAKSIRLKSVSYKWNSKPQAPLSPAFFKDMAEVHKMAGNLENSTAYYEQLIRKFPQVKEKLQYQYAIADNYYQANQFEKAKTKYKSILQVEKANNNQQGIEKCNTRIAACLISLGQTEEGIGYYNANMVVANATTTNTTVSFEDKSNLKQEYQNQNVEELSNALRENKLFKQEADFRSMNQAAIGNQSGLEYLRIAQSYYNAKEFQNCENALDNYLDKIDYNLLDVEEIEVLKNMSLRLKNESRFNKAYRYLINYNTIADSILQRISSVQQQAKGLGQQGVKNILEMQKLQQQKEVSEQTIEFLMKESKLQEEIVKTQRNFIYLLCVIIVLGIGAVIYILRVAKQRRIANQQLAMRSLRSQMNPHFIFNALNSVNSFIATSNERDANRFLTDFSTLMRTVLENSEQDFIPLSKEIEILKIYLELEHFRFKDKFNYKLSISESIDEDLYSIPPMLVQPYIENAIWHGLRYKETSGELNVHFEVESNLLMIKVEDNGIGRRASQEIKTKNQRKFKSTALKNINERIKILNSLHGLKIEIDITDAKRDGSGTVVSLKIPQLKKL